VLGIANLLAGVDVDKDALGVPASNLQCLVQSCRDLVKSLLANPATLFLPAYIVRNRRAPDRLVRAANFRISSRAAARVLLAFGEGCGAQR
jgi:hypothetical protein